LGHINASGLYTAPSKAGTDTVTAVSNADPTKSDSTVVKVTAASTPPPPSDPPPAPPASGTGLADAFFSMSYTQIEASHYPSVPFGGVRLWDTNTTWAQIETSRGSYNWTDLDIWLHNISSHGQDAMYTFGRVPHWASSQPSQACAYAVTDPGCAAPTSDLNSGDNIWKEFVTAVVKHSLSSPELHIAYYEMWNEPDLGRNWTGTPAQLATMVKDAYAIIHSLDPKAKVVGPTPSTANQYGVHFLPAYYAAGAASAQDIVWHPRVSLQWKQFRDQPIRNHDHHFATEEADVDVWHLQQADLVHGRKLERKQQQFFERFAESGVSGSGIHADVVDRCGIALLLVCVGLGSRNSLDSIGRHDASRHYVQPACRLVDWFDARIEPLHGRFQRDLDLHFDPVHGVSSGNHLERQHVEDHYDRRILPHQQDAG
jgi:hypothetical protein